MVDFLDIAQATKQLKAGKVLAMPTEAVYGLSVDPTQLDAVHALLALKGRDFDKGFILVAADLAQLAPWIMPLTDEMLQRVQPTWPGPVTWIVPAQPDVSLSITGGRGTLAIRVSAHPEVQAICRAFGPLVSTSANPSGKPPAVTAEQVRSYFGNDFPVLAGELGGLARPTTVRDVITGAVIRP